MLEALLRMAKGTGMLTIALSLAGGLSLNVSAASELAGHIYVNDNTAGTNTIAAFDRHSDGSLTPEAGSPFNAGGQGSGTVIGSQGSLQPSADGRFLLAADAGSNQVSVLRVLRDGSLRQVEGSPVWSGGVEPVSIAVHSDLVYVANEGDKTTGTGSNYTGFRLHDDGSLTPISHSTFALPNSANPGDILFNSTGRNLVGVEVGTSVAGTFLIDSFTVGEDGRVTPALGSPFPAQAPGPFGSEFSPANPAHLYVSNAHGGPGAGSVSAFRVTGSGSISSIGRSPFADGQTAPCWVEISHNGRYLFTVNTGSTSISSYRILSSGALRYLSTTPFKSGNGIRPFDARLDPSGRFLYVVAAAANTISAFAVSDGNLSELGGSPFALPAGATPFGVVAN